MKNRIGIIASLISSCFLFIFQGNAADYARISGAIYPGMKLEKIHESENGQEDILLKAMEAVAQARKIELNPLDTKTLHTMLSSEFTREIIGVPRKIEMLEEQREEQWNKHPEGGCTSTSIFTSSGAAALRIGIAIDNLPSSAELRFFQGNIVDDKAEFVVTGKEINRLIQLNMKSEPDNEYSAVYWSPVIEGESLGVEIYLPSGIEPDDVRISFSTLSHLAVSPFSSSDSRFFEKITETAMHARTTRHAMHLGQT